MTSRRNGDRPHFLKIFFFLMEESGAPVPRIAIYSVLAGISSAALLAIVNSTAAGIEGNSRGLPILQLGLFVLFIALFYITKRYTLDRSISLMEISARKVRLRLMDKIRQASLGWLEGRGKPEIYVRITRNVGWIIVCAEIIINAVHGATVILFALMYILFLSWPAFLITVGTMTLASVVWLLNDGRIKKGWEQGDKLEEEFFRYMEHIVDGFKEIKLNKRRNDGVFRELASLSAVLEDLNLRIGRMIVGNSVFSKVVFYLLLGAIVFVVPRYATAAYTSQLMKISTAILFIIGPWEALVGAIPLFNRANLAIDIIRKFEDEIDEALNVESPDRAYDRFTGFEQIELRGLQYAYKEANVDRSFVAGPFDLTVKKGELIVMVGGNGSGKSTFLKMFTGLYPAENGQILLDGRALSASDIFSYRELFSAIFTDFHLFDRIYGIPDLADERVNALLSQMQMGNKVSYRNGAFSTLNLSTGQRKRIGLITAILEDRPIYIFDEVAADQDPEFRQYFYEVLIREFQAQGKTIVMVSHDDKYFSYADRIITMKDGRIVEDRPTATGQEPASPNSHPVI